MVTSKTKKAKAKRTSKSTSRRRKSVAAKPARRGASKAKTAAAAPTELHPRLREQALRSERSNFPDDFHALYDRGFRASRGIAPVTAAAARAGSRRLAADVKGVEVQYDDATQLPNMVITRKPEARLSRPVNWKRRGCRYRVHTKSIRSLEPLRHRCGNSRSGFAKPAKS